jgi:carbonic anhydrase
MRARLSGSLTFIVVLGHSGCGALTAAVDVFLNPTDYLPFATKHSLRDILDGLLGNLSGGVNRARGSEQAFRREVRNITEDNLSLGSSERRREWSLSFFP